MSSEEHVNRYKNYTVRICLDGAFNGCLEENPEFVRHDPSDQSEVIAYKNDKARVVLRRPTLDGSNSEAWEAPWDSSQKLRMKIALTCTDGNKFVFTDAEENSFLLDTAELGMLESGEVRPYLYHEGRVILGQEVDETYLLSYLDPDKKPVFEMPEA